MNDAECLAEFRFRKHDLQILFKYLTPSDVNKEVLLKEWRVSAFFLEELVIHADTVTFLDPDCQYEFSAWSVMMCWILYITLTDIA